jgi:hypothetical protein
MTTPDLTADYVLLAFLVTKEGEQGHPMNTIVTRVDVDGDGVPVPAAMDELTSRVVREVQRKANSRPPAAGTERGRRGDDG